MSDEVWNSIKQKVKGQWLASNNLPSSCEVCGQIVIPVDFGVDPDLNERLWVTRCCGVTSRFIEVISEKDFLK